MEEIRGWGKIIIESEDGEVIADITANDYIAKKGYQIRLIPCIEAKKMDSVNGERKKLENE